VPARFLASKATLRLDTFMTWAIKIGGFSIIIAVFGIFLFIFAQVLPLFRGAAVSVAHETAAIPDAGKMKVLGVDEWAKMPFLYDGGDEVRFVDLDHSERSRRKRSDCRKARHSRLCVMMPQRIVWSSALQRDRSGAFRSSTRAKAAARKRSSAAR